MGFKYDILKFGGLGLALAMVFYIMALACGFLTTYSFGYDVDTGMHPDCVSTYNSSSSNADNTNCLKLCSIKDSESFYNLCLGVGVGTEFLFLLVGLLIAAPFIIRRRRRIYKVEIL